jgi:hypothetical protein
MASVEDPRRRAGTIELGALLVASVMAVVAVGVLRGGRGPGDRSVVNIVGDPLSATATADGLTLTISVERPEVVAGDRVRVDIALHNGRATPARWSSDGCGIPFTGGIDIATPTQSDWDGGLGSLASTLDAADPTPQTDLDDVRFGGRRELKCESTPVAHQVAPGGDLRERAVVDLRSADDEMSNETAELSATFAPGLTVTLPIRVVDAPARRPSGARALAAFTADHRLSDFLDSTRQASGWRVDMAWWQGGWELWVEPTNPSHSFRMRYDPSTEKIVDVRTIAFGEVPGNDRDFEPTPGSEPDVLIP